VIGREGKGRGKTYGIDGIGGAVHGDVPEIHVVVVGEFDGTAGWWVGGDF
jgi:hypothetical protein